MSKSLIVHSMCFFTLFSVEINKILSSYYFISYFPIILLLSCYLFKFDQPDLKAYIEFNLYKLLYRFYIDLINYFNLIN